MTYGQPFVGTDTGPALLWEYGLRGMLSRLGWRVKDVPNLSFDDLLSTSSSSSNFALATSSSSSSFHAKNSKLVGGGSKKVYKIVKQKFQQGSFPLILGSNHSIGNASLASILLLYPNTGILWIDAHANLNTPTISKSGNMHGMPIGLHVQGVMPPPGSPGSASTTIAGLEWLQHEHIPQLSPNNLVYIGLRNVDPAKRHFHPFFKNTTLYHAQN